MLVTRYCSECVNVSPKNLNIKAKTCYLTELFRASDTYKYISVSYVFVLCVLNIYVTSMHYVYVCVVQTQHLSDFLPVFLLINKYKVTIREGTSGLLLNTTVHKDNNSLHISNNKRGGEGA